MGVIYKIEHYLIIFMVNYNKAEWSADDNVIPLWTEVCKYRLSLLLEVHLFESI